MCVCVRVVVFVGFFFKEVEVLPILKREKSTV